ncbi:unnamed protein product [Ectocarpus sp. CCAP 1310/34]|nr:unnamed protein product [Ectocarpus sp. CCAP 1310/34]
MRPPRTGFSRGSLPGLRPAPTRQRKGTWGRGQAGGGRGSGRRGRGRARGRGGRGSRGRGGEGGAVPGVSAASMPSLAVGVPAFQQVAGAGTTSGGGEGGGPRLGVSAAGMPRLAVDFSVRRAGVTGAAVGTHKRDTTGRGFGAPLRSVGSAPRGGLGQASLGLASSASPAFGVTNSWAPESFQQSRLNGERLRAGENHGQPLPLTPQDVAFLDQVQSPQKKKHIGPNRRRASTATRNNHGGGQHVV